MENIIIKPLITEKLTLQTDTLGVYGFIVHPEANKIQIKAAIEKNYGVTVTDVNTVNYLGKLKHRYTKTRIISGRKNSFKKAIVTLKKGETIDFFSNVN